MLGATTLTLAAQDVVIGTYPTPIGLIIVMRLFHRRDELIHHHVIPYFMYQPTTRKSLKTLTSSPVGVRLVLTNLMHPQSITQNGLIYSPDMLKVPHKLTNQRFWHVALKYELLSSLAGLFLGIVCVIGGIVLLVCGVTGSTNWVGTFFGFHSNLTDASPGAVLFIVGLFIIRLTRFHVVCNRR